MFMLKIRVCYKEGTKNAPLFYKSTLLVLFCALLMFVLFCGNFQAISHSSGMVVTECSTTALFSSHNSFKDNIPFYGMILFSFVILAIFTKINLLKQRSSSSFLFLLISQKVVQFLYKLYNPIHEALRRGILHPQIYNFISITS